MRRAACLVTLLAAAALPSGAAAATVTYSYVPATEKYGSHHAHVDYRAGSGETNRLVVTERSGALELEDATGVVITPGTGCERPDAARPNRARCDGSRFSTATVDLGDGDDTATVHRGGTTLFLTLLGGDGADRLTFGTGASGTLAGGAGPDVLTGGAGEDDLDGGAGPDTLIGGDGDGVNDVVTYASSAVPVRVDLGSGLAVSEGETDTLRGFETAIGGSGADVLLGSPGDDQLRGGAGSDRLEGGAGGDTLLPGEGRLQRVDGGRGDDVLQTSTDESPGRRGDSTTLIGGPGHDTFSGGPGAETILARGGAQDWIGNCDGGRDSVTVDALDFVGGSPSGCERIRRSGAAVAVPTGVSRSSSGSTSLSVDLACPADATRICRASVEVRLGRTVAARFKARGRRGRVMNRELKIRGVLKRAFRVRRSVRITVLVRSRDRRGHRRLRRATYLTQRASRGSTLRLGPSEGPGTAGRRTLALRDIRSGQ